ncbi:MAG: DUF1622 domain-containing protein [Bryobacteraceae bacterium]|nr:DUF1622 domain-containing protein [Bryobacteraceae bacterium]
MLEGSRFLIESLAAGIEIATAGLIAVAVVEALGRAVPLFLRRGARDGAKAAVRLGLGRWLALSLELALAADILRTAVAPSWDDIGKLAAIAALRTALNYFLERETKEEGHGAAASYALSPNS